MKNRMILAIALVLASALLLQGAQLSRYAFDETSGTTATDSGTSSSNGQIGSNVTKGTQGRSGNSFTFSNDTSQAGVVDMGNATGEFSPLATSRSITISVWLKWTGSGVRD